MAKTVQFDLTEKQHERLAALKDERGYTWRGLMLEGAKRLDSDEQ